jgi:hypothetical protein
METTNIEMFINYLFKLELMIESFQFDSVIKNEL